MASLHRDPQGRSPYFYAAFGLPNGSRVFRSTKQTNYKQALRIALEWEKAAELAGRGELTEAASRKVLDLIREASGERAIPTKTVRAFFENWLAGKKLSKKASTGDRYKKPIREFLAGLGAKADKSLSSLTREDIERYRDALIKAGVSASTVGFDIAVVNGALLSAYKQGLLLSNPAAAVERPRPTPQKRDVFTREEVRSLIAAAKPEWKTTIMLGYFCGMRLMDAATITWDQINFSESAIRYGQGKTGDEVEIPMHPQLEAHLLSIAGDHTGALSPTLAANQTGGGNGLSQQFADLINRVGINRRQVQVSKSRKFSGLSFHSLRHGFASALANKRVTSDIRMLLTGHKDANIHQGYTHMQLKGLREAIAQLPSLGPGI